MPKSLASFRGRPLRLYLLGHACIFLGAWAMAVFSSMLPMALGASAALMLSAPLLRRLVAAATRSPRATGRR